MRLSAIGLLMLASTRLAAQGRTSPTPADYAAFEGLGQAALSPDGKWLAYTATRADERTELRVRSLGRDTTVAVAMGGAPLFSADSRWLVYTAAVTPEEREQLERDKKAVRASVGVMDLATLAYTRLGEASAHRLSSDGRFVAWRAYPADAAKRDAADLMVRELATGQTQTFGNVSAFAWRDGAFAMLAMTIETDAGPGNGLHLFDARSGRLSALVASADRYRGLAWRKNAGDLVVLRSRPSVAYKDTTHTVLAWTDVSSATSRARVLDPDSGLTAIGPGRRVSETRVPEWSKDGLAIVIGLRPRQPVVPNADSARSREKASDVQVWHAKDVRPIPQQKAQDQQDLRRTLAAVWRLADGALTVVGTDLMETAIVPEGGRFGAEVLAKPYAFGAMFGRPQRDVDVVNLATGERRRALEGVRFFGGASPSGRLLAYFSDGRWMAYDAATGVSTVLGANARDAFVDVDDDHPLPERGHRGLAGWSPDERWLFVNSKYDLWRLAVDGSAAERLTNGESERVVHRLTRLNAADQTVDLSQPVYLSLAGEWSKQSGYARLHRGTLERLHLGHFLASRLMRADSAPVFAYVRERFDTPPQWHVGAADLRDARQVSATNATFATYDWGKAELVEFASDSGQRLQGALYYPAGYDPTRKYPMIVNTYELMSGALHNFVVPNERAYYNRSVWTLRGYFVFTPDVVFRPGDPGRSYMECVVPAVRSVIARGLVDSARIGLVGHSWGGYEAAYAPTQTTLFATSIAGAPITNFLSFSGAFHWTGGFPEFDHWETGQARMGRPPWEDVEGHLRNSPAAHVANLKRPMLMAFGDADGTVDWHQGVEFYNFARRAGKEDFVMLVYPGEDHGLRKKENQIDYHRRILEWFGHYLQGRPAPEWMRRGVTWQERKAIAPSER